MALGAQGALPRAFYERETAIVARDLLGCVLECGGARLVIAETEAYVGAADRACHTFGGRRTARVEPMWGPGGHAYVYRIYGLHDCMNVVTRTAGEPEAVLVRAGVPESFFEGAPLSRQELLAASGPGRLCRRLGITREHSGLSLRGPALRILRGREVGRELLSGPRVGIDSSGEAALWPLRFALSNCPAVTARSTLRPYQG